MNIIESFLNVPDDDIDKSHCSDVSRIGVRIEKTNIVLGRYLIYGIRTYTCSHNNRAKARIEQNCTNLKEKPIYIVLIDELNIDYDIWKSEEKFFMQLPELTDDACYVFGFITKTVKIDRKKRFYVHSYRTMQHDDGKTSMQAGINFDCTLSADLFH